MFTGLIEDLGKVRELVRAATHCRLTIDTALPCSEIELGESIAVNGVCLTVVRAGEGFFAADVSPETLKRSGLAGLRPGSRVNLERALRLSDRLGGHLVTGHIDTVATLAASRREGNAVHLSFSLDPGYHRYVVEKGSICIDGISLTVNDLTPEGFTVTIIPHTLEQTTLQYCQPGDVVNIETDLIGKYVERLLNADSSTSPKEPLSLEYLAKHGFI